MFEWLTGKRKHLALDIASVNECGLVRKDNQDHFLIDPSHRLFCVADGMGGGQGGAEASYILCDSMSNAAKAAKSFSDLVKRGADAISEANRKIRAYAAERNWRHMGTTLASVFLYAEGANPVAVLAHIGDSRIYRLRFGELELLTYDHTVAGELSRRQSMRVIADELAKRAGPLSHVLTRAVGIEDVVHADWRKIDIHKGDTYLICSDGIYDMADKDALRNALMCDTSTEAVKEISRAVLIAGAHDNFTCITIKIGDYE